MNYGESGRKGQVFVEYRQYLYRGSFADIKKLLFFAVLCECKSKESGFEDNPRCDKSHGLFS